MVVASPGVGNTEKHWDDRNHPVFFDIVMVLVKKLYLICSFMRSNASVIPSESIKDAPTNSLFLKPKIVGGGGNTIELT